MNIIVPPTITDKRQYERWFAAIYEEGNLVVDVDEAGVITSAGGYAPSLQACVRLGADRGIGVILVSQRVRNLPGFFRSEADHICAFQLQNQSDRQALEEDTGVSWEAARDLKPYHWLYYGPGVEYPVVMPPLQNVKFADLYNG